MTHPHRTRIAAAFSAADDYDRAARVQARVADRLAARIAAAPVGPRPRLLEIGCGTGLLTSAMDRAGIGGDWLVTDLSPAMIGRCQARMAARPRSRFAVLDGEHGPCPDDAPFDLIVSSLTFQWFGDLTAATARLLGWLAPGGHLIFATLAGGTFAEWRAAHEAEGLRAGTPPFPPAADVTALHPRWQAAAPEIITELDRHADAHAFLRDVKAIGAQTPAAGHQPLAPAALRRVMRRFEAAGACASYEVVTMDLQRKETA